MNQAFRPLGAPTLALLAALGMAGCGGRVGVEEYGNGGADAGNTPPDTDGGGPGDVGPPTACPDVSAIFPGETCDIPGELCTSDNVPVNGCGPGFPPPERGVCTCETTGWTCPPIALPCDPPPPVPMCPAPENVFPGSSCSNELGLTCLTSNIKTFVCGTVLNPRNVPCNCSPAGWQCAQMPAPSCPPPPPPTCPNPTAVIASTPCAVDGLTCKGNPQVCDGATFYDALECRGQWVAVATTVCGTMSLVDASVDGGPEDAPAGD